jgi:hypothetical protein
LSSAERSVRSCTSRTPAPLTPLRGEYEGPDAGRIDFSEYGADFDITAPSDAVDRRQLDAEELAWLGAVEELHAKIDEPFTASTINLTRSKMVSLGETSPSVVASWTGSVRPAAACSRSMPC